MGKKFKGKWDIRSFNDIKSAVDLNARRKSKTKQRIPYELTRGEKSKNGFKKKFVKQDENIVVLDDKYAFVPMDKDSGVKEQLKDELRKKIDASSIQNKDHVYDQVVDQLNSRFANLPPVIMVLSEYESEGSMSGDYSINTNNDSPAYSAIATSNGYHDWTFINSSQFNTGATWSFANSQSGTHFAGQYGNEIHQFDHTGSFVIRTFSSGSFTGSFIVAPLSNTQIISENTTILSGSSETFFTTPPEHSITISGSSILQINQGALVTITPSDSVTDPALNVSTSSRVDAGNFEYYEFRTGSKGETGVGVGISTAGFNRTIVDAKIFGDGDETTFEASFSIASGSDPNNNLFAASRELITFPHDTVVSSGSFIHSTSFPTLTGFYSPGQTGYSPNYAVTLYWSSGSGGFDGVYGLSGSITPNQLIPDSDSIAGIPSGSHIFLNKELTAPASGGYYAILSPLFNNASLTSTLSDGNLQGGFAISGTIHVAGDGMRGTSTPGEEYFQNPFRNAHSAHIVSSSIITAAPRWNGISFSRGSALTVGDINPEDYTD